MAEIIRRGLLFLQFFLSSDKLAETPYDPDSNDYNQQQLVDSIGLGAKQIYHGGIDEKQGRGPELEENSEGCFRRPALIKESNY